VAVPGMPSQLNLHPSDGGGTIHNVVKTGRYASGLCFLARVNSTSLLAQQHNLPRHARMLDQLVSALRFPQRQSL
jgi:hypothetical protein